MFMFSLLNIIVVMVSALPLSDRMNIHVAGSDAQLGVA